jgi:hypothetical protein
MAMDRAADRTGGQGRRPVPAQVNGAGNAGRWGAGWIGCDLVEGGSTRIMATPVEIPPRRRPCRRARKVLNPARH